MKLLTSVIDISCNKCYIAIYQPANSINNEPFKLKVYEKFNNIFGPNVYFSIGTKSSNGFIN